MSGFTAQDGAWKSKEMSDEARYIRQKEAEQLAAIRDNLPKRDSEPEGSKSENPGGSGENAASQKDTKPNEPFDRDFEGGYGGQEDLEDRYATTYGAH